MNLKTFMRALDVDQRKQFLQMAGTTQNYVWQITGGHRRPSLRILQRLALASRAMFPVDKSKQLNVGHMSREWERAAAKKQSQGVAV